MEEIEKEAERLIELFRVQFQKLPNTRWRGELDLATKQCALICINEIIKNESRGFDYEDCNPITRTNIEHWQQVKQYIKDNY